MSFAWFAEGNTSMKCFRDGGSSTDTWDGHEAAKVNPNFAEIAPTETGMYEYIFE